MTTTYFLSDSVINGDSRKDRIIVLTFYSIVSLILMLREQYNNFNVITRTYMYSM